MITTRKRKDIPLGYASILAASITALVGIISHCNSNEKQETLSESRDRTDSSYAKWVSKQVKDPSENSIGTYNDNDLWALVEINQKNIEELWISGAHLQFGYGKIKNEVKDLVLNGRTVKIIMTNPKSPWIKLYALRKNMKGNDDELIRLSIQATLLDLSQLIQELPVKARTKLEVYLIDFPLDERMHLINPDKSNGTIYVKDYPYQEDEGILFGGLYFEIDPNDANFYNYYYNKFLSYEKSSVKFQPDFK